MNIYNFFDKNFKIILSLLSVITTFSLFYFLVLIPYQDNAPYRHCLELGKEKAINTAYIRKNQLLDEGKLDESLEVNINSYIQDAEYKCYRKYNK